MPESAILPGEPFTAEETERLISQFRREGYCDLGQVLEPEEVEALREDMQRKWEDPAMHEPERDQIRGRSLMRMFEYSTAFRDFIVKSRSPASPRRSSGRTATACPRTPCTPHPTPAP
ncbi:MAG: hypothetical protein OXH50_10760 [Gemmatimonadetes bacterium]|nr:hypothetical protein [Gemmatimonadota bacterium]